MKGLFLKDLYMMRAYFKSYVLIGLAFLAASLFGNNTFFIYYPCLLCGMIPVNLLAYDERSRFTRFCDTLPISRARVVSEKYLIGLFTQGIVVLITGVVQGIRMAVADTFEIVEYCVILLSLMPVSALASCIPLPLMFKYGVEKGRIAYYVMFGVVCGIGVLLGEGVKTNVTRHLPFCALVVLAALMGLALYTLSFSLSVRFYQKREL